MIAYLCHATPNVVRYDQLNILSRDQLVKSLLVIKAVLNKCLVHIFAWKANLGKLRKGLQVRSTNRFIP